LVKKFKFWCLAALIAVVVRAEDPALTAAAAQASAQTQDQEQAAAAAAAQAQYAAAQAQAEQAAAAQPAPAAASAPKSARDQLIEKLTKRDGTSASIVVFAAIETPQTALGINISKMLASALQSYGKLDVRNESYALSALTMEDIRLAMARYNVDILITPLVRETTLDLFLFDRRTPYNLYAHSEEIPPTLRGSPTETVAQEMTRVLIKRILFRYLNEQFFELPREESLPVLQAEIPQWVASEDSLNLVNREFTSRFYLNFSLGAGISLAKSGQLWNSNLIAAQVGYRITGKLYAEAQWAAFSYNAFVGSLRYTFVNRDSPFRINVGLGFGMLNRDKAWNADQTIGLGRFSYYIVPSAALLFPIGDVYLKLEGQTFVSLGFNQFVWTVMPGVQIHF
jgi:hypothetical protein